MTTPPRRLIAPLAAVSLAVAGLVVPVSAAVADSAPPPGSTQDPTVTIDALPTVQIDGVAWTQVVVGDTVYVGGEFTTARPAGAAPGVDTVARTNLLAYDLETGELVPGWAPRVDGPVYAIAASPDGRRIYVGGDFQNVEGITRARFAALDATTGGWVAFGRGTNAAVRDIEVGTSTVYIAGNFNVAGGQDRPRVAAFDSRTGALRPWRVSAQSAAVESIVLSPDESRLILGGRFEKVNEVPALGSAAVSTATGAVLRWDANQVITNWGFDAGITHLDSDGEYVYGTGFAFLNSSGVGYGNLEGVFAADPMTGEIRWLADCHGDTYGVHANRGKDHVYVTGHPHNCQNIAGPPEQQRRVHHWGLALGKEPDQLVERNNYLSYFNFEGQPAPTLRQFYPEFTPGLFTGQRQAGWDVTGAGDYVLYAGEFTHVNGRAQQGLVRFGPAEIAPGEHGPLGGSSSLAPAVRSLAAGSVQLSWASLWDRDQRHLTYRVLRDGEVVHEQRMPSEQWQLPRQSFVDTGLTPDQVYRYRVQAVDAAGNAVTSSDVSMRAATSGTLSAYAERVLQDAPSAYWRLGESSGSPVNWTGHTNATAGFSVQRAVDGAIAGDTDRAARFTGASTSRVYAGARDYTQSRWAPNRFSVEAWFRTTSGGGKIIGLGSTAGTNNSSTYDRHVYLTTDGRLTFGVHPRQVRTIQSTETYTDGEWHHVVATSGDRGLELYADGVLVAADPTVTSAELFNGVWRIGGDNLNGWPDAGNGSFVGDIDEVAVYGYQLDPVQVFTHHGIGRTGSVPNMPPTADFTATPGVLRVDVDGRGSVDLDGTVTQWHWDFGDGATATGSTASHTYDEAGTYTLTLTVTDDGGATAVKIQEVEVLPPNAPPTAAFDVTVDDLTATLDGSLSTDTDGSVVGWVWDFGDGTGAEGAVVTKTWTEAGTFTVTLTVTDDDGASATTSTEVEVTAPDTGYVAFDAFDRTVGAGWGVADMGGPWVTTAGVSSVSGGQGTLVLTGAGSSAGARLPGAQDTDLVTTATITLDRRPSGLGSYALVRGRITGGGEYRVKLNHRSDGSVTAWLVRSAPNGSETNLTQPAVVPGLTYSAGTPLTVALELEGAAPTVLRAKVWVAGTAEPGWQLTASDSAPGLQEPGHTGVAFIASSTMSNGPATVRVDDFSVIGPGGALEPVPNVPPTPAFSVSSDGLSVEVDGRSSADTDGTVTQWTWSFGDGGAATGSTATHTYASAGTYPVTLTVTDDDGATAALTQQVTVTAAPDPDPDPGGGPLGEDRFGRTVATGLGVADVGGAWAASAGTAVSGGAAVFTLPGAGSLSSSRLPGAEGQSTSTVVTTAFDRRPNGSGGWTLVRGRITPGGEYRLKTSYAPDGQVRAWVVRTTAAGAETQVGPVATAPTTYGPGTAVVSRVEVTGSSPTTVRARIWDAASAEPDTWLLEVTDSTAALQGPGHVGLAALVSSSTSNGPVTVRFDDLVVTDLAAVLDDPPGDEPPGDEPPGDEPPGDEPPGDEPPGDEPPGDEPPGDEPPGDEPPGTDDLATDDFERDVADGFGTADEGGAWVATSGATSVADGVGRLMARPGATVGARLPGVEGTETALVLDLGVDARPTGGGAWALVRGRIAAGGEYRLRTELPASGPARTWFVRTDTAGRETALSAPVPVGVAMGPDVVLSHRVEVVGTEPTTLRARVWRAGTPEPTDWLVEVTDDTPALQAAGHTGVALTNSSWAAAALTATVDRYRVTRPSPV